ncbi:glycosyltransferase family 2 protein [Adhaeribacter soli]|uniref:Glycosyltransferase family 2 protein n=1 Tax=Adhaeribacter soli TaxID=2607655 RepID=A0A5N1J664_9BACT|nr:glycosyltransferase family 2 protein [Adhaeribacter soli]
MVILNWNGREYLEQFLPSVIANSPGCEVIVADNASSDDSVTFLKSHFPQVRLIELSQNFGFCEGYNQALKQVDTEYYVLLNSDVLVTPGWVVPIHALMQENPDIAACQPKIKSYHEPHLLEYAGAGGGLFDVFGYPFCRGRIFDSLEEDKGQYNDTSEIFWATGACMFVRAADFHDLGGLEPAFFAHMEEIDLCWRLQNKNRKIFYCGQSEVYHVGGGTLHKSNPRKTFLNYRNGLALLVKNLADEDYFSTMFIRILLDWISAVKFLVSGQTADAKAIYKAHQEVYRKRLYWRQKRVLQTTKKPLSKLHGIYPRSLVWAYFAEGKKRFSDLVSGK